jgi:hypothetical protein
MGDRSQFVTGIAWTFIALSVLSMLGTVPLGLATWFLLDAAAYESALDEAIRTSPVPVPEWMAWTFHNLKEVLAAGAALSVASLLVSIGLLKRWRWAHAAFVLLMALGALLHVAWAAVPFVAGSPAAGGRPMLAMALGSAVFALAFGVLYAWLAYMLMTPAVRAEFSRRAHTGHCTDSAEGGKDGNGTE